MGDRRPARLIARTAVVVAGTVAVAAGIDLWDGWSISRAERAVGVQRAAIARGDVAGALTPAILNVEGGTPRRDLYRALILAQAASVTADPRARARRVAEAERLAARADASRPRWAEAELVRAYAASLAGGGGPPARMLASLSASYRSARYLHDGGAWRVAQAFAAWERLPTDVRDRAAAEAVWLARASSEMRPQIFALAFGSAAAGTFSRRWIEMRRWDAARRAGKRTTP